MITFCGVTLISIDIVLSLQILLTVEFQPSRCVSMTIVALYVQTSPPSPHPPRFQTSTSSVGSHVGTRQKVSMWQSWEAAPLAVGAACGHSSAALLLIGMWTWPWVGVSSTPPGSAPLVLPTVLPLPNFFRTWVLHPKWRLSANEVWVNSKLNSAHNVNRADGLWLCLDGRVSWAASLGFHPHPPTHPLRPHVLHPPSSAACQSPAVT